MNTLKVNLKTKALSWQRAKIAGKIIRQKVAQVNSKSIRQQKYTSIKILQSLNCKIWSSGCKKPGLYINVQFSFDPVNKTIFVDSV